MHVFGLGGQDGSQVKQLMLDSPQNGDQRRHRFPAGAGGRDRGHADESVQFVHRAVALDAGRVLGDALAAGQVGLALVAGLGVDAVERETRLFELGSGTGVPPVPIVSLGNYLFKFGAVRADKVLKEKICLWRPW